MAVDFVPFRLQAAKTFGADEVFDPSEDIPGHFREMNEGRLADVVLVCAGAKKAQIQGLDCVERGGMVLLFAPTDPDVTVPIHK